MDQRLAQLCDMPYPYDEQNQFLFELREECQRLEYLLLDAAEDTSQLKMLLGSYIAARDELEFQSVKAALRFGKK